mgnify:CR=1 FL=1
MPQMHLPNLWLLLVVNITLFPMKTAWENKIAMVLK